MNSVKDDFKALLAAFVWYSKKKIKLFGFRFETLKNFSVDLLMYKRGVLQKKFWHGSIIILVLVGLFTSGVFGGQTLVSTTYPGIGGPDPRFATAFEPYPQGLVLEDLQSLHTDISIKPRSSIEDYQVKEGDTLSSISKEKGISVDTIKSANNLTSESIKPGQTLKILPVTGVAHSVKSGDTLESVAKKYQTESQGIVDFPFNDVPDDFKLKIGQVLIVPDGVMPEAAPVRRSQPQYLAQGPSAAFSAPGGASFVWPTAGQLSQYFAWYHPGIDVANRGAPGIAASAGGTVIVAGWPDGYGYGNRVVVDHGNGYSSLYAHLSNIYVGVGQNISRGQIIGQMGSTGRSTGVHLHFEIHFKGVPVNPLAILK